MCWSFPSFYHLSEACWMLLRSLIVTGWYCITSIPYNLLILSASAECLSTSNLNINLISLHWLLWLNSEPPGKVGKHTSACACEGISRQSYLRGTRSPWMWWYHSVGWENRWVDGQREKANRLQVHSLCFLAHLGVSCPVADPYHNDPDPWKWDSYEPFFPWVAPIRYFATVIQKELRQSLKLIVFLELSPGCLCLPIAGLEVGACLVLPIFWMTDLCRYTFTFTPQPVGLAHCHPLHWPCEFSV